MMDRTKRTLTSGALVFSLGFFPVVVQAQIQHPPVRPRVLPSCTQVNQPVTLTLNTGTAGAPPPPGTVDPIWTVVQPPSLTPFTTSPFLFPNGWLPNSAAKWIQPASGGTPVNLPATTFVYSTQFTTPVDPYLYTSITITGNFAADDSALVKLNGITIATCTPTPTAGVVCFHSLQAIPPGVVGLPMFNRLGSLLNTLTVEVKNTVSSPTGLFVQAQVVAVCSKCTSPQPPACGGNPSTCKQGP